MWLLCLLTVFFGAFLSSFYFKNVRNETVVHTYKNTYKDTFESPKKSPRWNSYDVPERLVKGVPVSLSYQLKYARPELKKTEIRARKRVIFPTGGHPSVGLGTSY